MQTLAVVVTLPLIYWQVSSDLTIRKKEQTMEHIASMTYKGEVNIKLCGIDLSGNIMFLSKDRAVKIYNTPELKAEINKLLAEFEFYATGINQGVFDFEVANKLNGGYTIEQFKRYYEYIQLVISSKSDASYKQRVYDQLEQLVVRLNKSRSNNEDLPKLKRK